MSRSFKCLHIQVYILHGILCNSLYGWIYRICWSDAICLIFTVMKSLMISVQMVAMTAAAGDLNNTDWRWMINWHVLYTCFAWSLAACTLRGTSSEMQVFMKHAPCNHLLAWIVNCIPKQLHVTTHYYGHLHGYNVVNFTSN